MDKHFYTLIGYLMDKHLNVGIGYLLDTENYWDYS